MRLSADHIARLIEVVGPEHARDHAALGSLDPGVDPHNFGGDLLLKPASTAEVARLLAYCNAAGIPVVPQGGRTGLSGGAASGAGQVLLCVGRMNRILSFDPVSRVAVVEAGVTLGALARLAKEHGLSAGIDFGARDSATIGGMASTNAGGITAFRHGTTRDRILGLEAVLADGSVLSELGQVRKRNEGLAVEQLFIGAEGTLGVITRVALALVAEEPIGATALVATPDAASMVALADRLQRTAGLQATALEFMSGNHAATTAHALGLHEFEGIVTAAYVVVVEATSTGGAPAEDALTEALGELASSGVVLDAIVAQSEAQRRAMWRVREDWAVDRERPGGLWYDVSVPLSALPAYLARIGDSVPSHDPALSVFTIGHLADGNVHVTVNAGNPIVARYDEIAPLVTEGLQEVGGSYSAEHGIGLEKKPTLMRLQSMVKQDLMRRLKATLDPRGIMNPGKVIPD